LPPEPEDDADSADDSAWEEANRLEYVQNNFLAAANAYAAIERDALAMQSPAVNFAARALQSQARCYFHAGQSEKAIQILGESLGEVQFAEAIDLEGRLIVADAELRALELLLETPGTSFAAIADRLRARLSDYADGRLSASQRLFLMKRLQSLIPDQANFPTLHAEELAQHFLDIRSSPTKRRAGRISIRRLRTGCCFAQAVQTKPRGCAHGQGV
jgi:hypothetical protein